MIMQKKWTTIFVVSILLAMTALLVVNLVIDPFSVFGNQFLKYHYQPNERFIKSNFIIKNHDKFDSYLFGSSRIGNTSPKLIEKYISNTKFYNFTVSSANLVSDYNLIKYFVDNKYKVKNIYLQVDIIENFICNKTLPTDFLRLDHPSLNNQSMIAFYFKYLTISPFENIRQKLILNFFEPDKHDIFNFYTDGTWVKQYRDKKIAIDQDKYIKEEPTLNVNKVKRSVQGTYIKENIEALKEIVSLAKGHDINLIVFVTPHNYNLLNQMNENDYYTFLRDISALTNFYDFSGYNSITLNNKNYYEESHYRSYIAEYIAARIFNDKSVNIPGDFGVYVTKENINAHIKDLKQQFKKAAEMFK